MVLGSMIHMVLIIIIINNNTFELGSQSPVSAMSAIRNTNSNTNSNIPYLHRKLAEAAIPMRPVLLRLAIVVVQWWSHLRIHPSLKICNWVGGGVPL